MTDIKLTKTPVEITTTYRHFLSDIAPGGFLVAYIVFFFGNDILSYIQDIRIGTALLLLSLFIAIPIGFVLNVASYICLDNIIGALTIKYINTFINITDYEHDSKHIFERFKNTYGWNDILKQLYHVRDVISFYDAGKRINETLSRIKGIEIFCRTLSFLLCIFLIITPLIKGFNIGIFFGHLIVIILLFITASFLIFYELSKMIQLAQTIYYLTKKEELSANTQTEINAFFQDMKQVIIAYFEKNKKVEPLI